MIRYGPDNPSRSNFPGRKRPIIREHRDVTEVRIEGKGRIAMLLSPAPSIRVLFQLFDLQTSPLRTENDYMAKWNKGGRAWKTPA